ncbi:MAG: phospholipid carrier-dependent glycosyltransferase [Deltaproteobacteria bacterium]|jgi:4-amino-4-deoxy-L-arabinose transferase-like glycosyltransferase|nr:phospholipid carrier-dependent glycosyltransferase [Deltaproteobacteria bacterium]MBT4526274.1 phospholipid carrier-dependent glycosyltransferase [Deltaproteobacteria bacterium]
MKHYKLSQNTVFFSLLVFTLLFLLSSQGASPLIDWDENIYAEASKQMLIQDNFLDISINNQSFSEKPPLFFWLQTISFRIFGINEFGARFISCISGTLLFLLLFKLGSWVKDYVFGAIWSVVFLTSLLPMILAKSGVIDHTFNLFITCATFFLYIYDVKYKAFIEEKGSSRSTWIFLSLASICMGLAVLTKGPLGGLIPLIGFGGYKLFNKKPGINPIHFVFCAVLSLTIAISWYLINYAQFGDQFLVNFWDFQSREFNTPLEGHSGPFYFHFAVAIFGLLPWTAFLCSFRKGQMSLLNKHTKALAIISTVWIGFVLILFSFSATKLPHHSASIYVPLSFIVSLIIYHHWKNSSQVSSLTVSFFIISSVTISAALIALPQLAEQFLEQDNINFTLKWPNEIYIMNGLFIGLIFIAGALFRSRKIAYGVACTAIAAFIFSQTLWRHYVPTYLSYSQQPLINMIKEVKGEGGKIAFYRFISFAAIYYGEEPIEMLGTSKFEGDFSILDKAQSDNIYIFTADRNNRERLIKEHPLVKLLEIRGVFAKFILSKK